jgi:DNA-binding transcriptional LysR family regulator
LRVGAIRYVACASPAYLKRRGTPTNPRDLEAHDCISFSNLSSAERWSFAGRKPQRVRVKPRLIVNTAEAAIDAAKAGLGIARVLSYQAAAPLAERSLRLILDAYEPDALPVHILHREDRLPQAKVQSFIAFAAPRLRAELSGRPSRSSRSS